MLKVRGLLGRNRRERKKVIAANKENRELWGEGGQS